VVVDADLVAAERVVRDIHQGNDYTAVAEAVAADVSLSDEVRRYVVAAAAEGPIDAVVHAAGVAGAAAPMPEFEEAEFARVMAINARGTFLGLKYAFPHMRDGGASSTSRASAASSATRWSPRTSRPSMR
jgi:NAD(P)-dependent dehydrogenase (short-subunit alcohol dehydrogenase family)